LRQRELHRLRGQNEKPNVQPFWSRNVRLHVLWDSNKVQGVIVFAMGLLASPARGQELDAAWFKANYLPAAQKLEKFYGECSAKVTETGTNDKSDELIKATFSFAFDGARRKFDRTTEDNKDGVVHGFSRTIVASPEVSFKVLTKRGQGPILESVNRSSMGFAQATARIDEAACDSFYAPFALLSKRVSQYIQDKDFEIKSVKREGDRVRLDFHYKNNDFQSDGWVVFLPSLRWVIDRWDISVKVNKPAEYSYRIASEMRYGNDDPVPALTGSTATTYHPDRTDTNKLVVDELTFTPVPAEVFKLSRYGYDDRIGQAPSAFKSLWFWLASAGIISLLAAFALRRRHARIHA
jgi:hypothetical protein